MSRRRRNRKGHDLETVIRPFSDDDLAELKPKKLFVNKWIIMRKLEKRGSAHCYQVCDKKCNVFGVLYLEKGEDNVTSIPGQVEFSIQQYSQGYSHHFTNLIDCSIINNHVFYMVIKIRPGPTISQLFDCTPDRIFSSITASFMAIDLLSCFELLNSSGHVLRNFNPRQWQFDVETRMFYLDDTSDVGVSSDKRHRSIDEIHLLSSPELNLSWTSHDVLYAPCSFIVNGPQMHRMSELDELEMLIYVLYDWTRGHLPWTNSKDQQKTLEMKREFLENLPDIQDYFDNQVDSWFNIALHNLADHLKTAKLAQERLEKQAVRGGAWCPKGPRAGALLSIINYRRIIEDFHKIVCSGRPEWSVHWRDVKLDFDKETPLTESQQTFLQKYEKRRLCLQLVDEWKRLEALREHYEIQEDDHLFENEKNRLSIERYLRGDGEMTAEENAEMEAKLKEWKVKIRLMRELKQAERWKMKTRAKEIKEELDDAEYAGALGTSSSHDALLTATATTTFSNSQDVNSRTARLARRRHLKEDKEINTEEKKEIKEEELDYGYDSIPVAKQSKRVEEIEPKQDIKIEEPDDYDD